MTQPDLSPADVERVARIIAEELGDDFDRAFTKKSEWRDARGGEPFRDVNMPYKGDYLAAATAAIRALPDHGLREALETIARKAELAVKALGNSDDAFNSCRMAFQHLADLARQALSDGSAM